MVPNTPAGYASVVIAQAFTMTFAVRTSQPRRETRLAADAALWTVIVVSLALVIFDPGGVLLGSTSIIGGVLLFIAPLVILRRIAEHTRVTIQTVLGIACVYMLIGMFFAFVFAAIGQIQGGDFFEQVKDATYADYLYFSYVTELTIGYGDLVPASQLGKSLAVFDALFGQLFLVTVLGRVVSLWGRDVGTRSERRMARQAGKAPLAEREDT